MSSLQRISQLILGVSAQLGSPNLHFVDHHAIGHDKAPARPAGYRFLTRYASYGLKL